MTEPQAPQAPREGQAPPAPSAEPPQEQLVPAVHELPGGLRGAVEAVLMVADEPVDAVRLAAVLAVPPDDVLDQLHALRRDWEEQHRGYELRELAGGWRVHSRGEYAEVVARFVVDGQSARLSQAALETLAVVAYKQPVSRARVSAVRGVSVDAVMRTLLTRGLVEEVGTDRESGAVLYGTTAVFLERMGLAGLEQLPALAPYLPEAEALEEIAEAGR